MSHNLRSKVPKRTFGFDLRDRTKVAQYEASKGRADISSSSNQSVSNGNTSIFGLGNVTSGFTGGILKSANKQMRMKQTERVHFKDGEPDMCRISEGAEKSPMVKSATPKRPTLHTPKKVTQSTPCKASDLSKRKRPASTPKHQKSSQTVLCIDHLQHISRYSDEELLNLKNAVDNEIQKRLEEKENLEGECALQKVNFHSPEYAAELQESHASSGQISVVNEVPVLHVETTAV